MCIQFSCIHRLAGLSLVVRLRQSVVVETLTLAVGLLSSASHVSVVTAQVLLTLAYSCIGLEPTRVTRSSWFPGLLTSHKLDQHEISVA